MKLEQIANWVTHNYTGEDYEKDIAKLIYNFVEKFELTQRPERPVDVNVSHAPKRFYWKQCYEIGDNKHWALCDTESDKQHKISSSRLVLFHSGKSFMEQKFDDDALLKRIVRLLNEDEIKIAAQG